MSLKAQLFPHDVLRQVNNPYVGGSVSTATHNTAALLLKFQSALVMLVQLNGDLDGNPARLDIIEECRKWLEADQVAQGLSSLETEPETEEELESQNIHDEAGTELVEKLQQLLGDFAPSGYFFGTHDGDGADFGFWVTDHGSERENRQALQEQLQFAIRQIVHVLIIDDVQGKPLRQDGLGARELLEETENTLKDIANAGS